MLRETVPPPPPPPPRPGALGPKFRDGIALGPASIWTRRARCGAN